VLGKKAIQRSIFACTRPVERDAKTQKIFCSTHFFIVLYNKLVFCSDNRQPTDFDPSSSSDFFAWSPKIIMQHSDSDYFHSAGPAVEAEIAQSRMHMLNALYQAGALTQQKALPRIEHTMRPIREKPYFEHWQPRHLIQEKPKKQRSTSKRLSGPLKKPKAAAGKGKPLNRSKPKKKGKKPASVNQKRAVRVRLSISVS
jgi:hypothetical protein